MNQSAITLVTGATGLVGNNVVRLLRARGESVRVLLRAASNRQSLDGLDLEIAEGDVRDAASVRRACEGAGCVLHCAGYVNVGWAKPEVYRAINVDGTRHVVDSCRALGLRMVHVSSTDVFGGCSLDHPTDEETPPGPGPLVPYVVTKRESEQIVTSAAAEGLNASIVNPAFMLGPWDWKPSSGRMLIAAARGLIFFAPRGTFSLCDVRDVAAALITARDRGQIGRRYILAGRTLEWIDALRQFAKVGGWRSPLCCADPITFKLSGRFGDLWSRLSGKEPDLNSAAVALAALPKNYSSARATAELGYTIRPTEETIRDALAWFREHGYVK